MTKLSFGIVAVACIALSSTPFFSRAKTIPGKKVSNNTKLFFTENKGQVADVRGNLRPDILFTANGNGAKLFITATSINYQFVKTYYPAGYNPAKMQAVKQGALNKEIKTETCRFTVSLDGANSNPVIHKEQKKDYYENYYLAHCPNGIRNVGTYERLVYENVYPGIDWVIHTINEQGSASHLKYDFIVHPGADPRRIKLKISNAQNVVVVPSGGLQIKGTFGTVMEQAPVSYVNGQKVFSRFVQDQRGYIGFDVADFGNETLTIDPGITWSTYYGGAQEDEAMGCSADAMGNIYIAGGTFSTMGIADGGFQDTIASVGVGSDGYLAKFDALGNRLWCTYYGGENEDNARSCAVDTSGNVYLAGITQSQAGIASAGFLNAISDPGTDDAFLAKFDSSGGRLWATYYGGEEGADGNFCVFDNNNNVYLLGNTTSHTGIASGGFQNTTAGYGDAFLVKFDAAGNRLWATYYGGDLTATSGNTLAADVSGNIFLSATTGVTSGVATAGSFQDTYGGGTSDGLLVKFGFDGSRPWATYYGGADADKGDACATDLYGNVYLAGEAGAASVNIASGGFQNTYGGGNDDAYLAKFSASGNRLWATYYGGSSGDYPFSVNTDAFLNVYLSGSTFSSDSIASGGFQNTYSGSFDGFVVKFSSNGNRLWGSYFGGTDEDLVTSSTVDMGGNFYFAGYTASVSGVAASGFQDTAGGGIDGFLVKIGQIMVTALNPGHYCAGDAVPVSIYGAATDSFFADNVFTVELSDATGSFAAPIIIGTLAGATANTIPCVVPLGVVSGTGYRVRIRSSDPAITGDDNGTDVTIQAVPVISGGSSVVIPAGGSTTLSASGAGIGGTYSWSPATGLSCTNCSNPTASPAVTTTYTVTGATSLGCTDSATVTVTVNALGITNANGLTNVNIYPNPAKDILFIENATDETKAVITTAVGQIVLEVSISAKKQTIDIHSLPAGVYILQLSAADGSKESIRLVKE